VVENVRDVDTIVRIFERYPPLTGRTLVQLQFLREMRQKTALGLASEELMPFYYVARSSKYSARALLLRPSTTICTSLPYYNAWLSGFIEAAGCFSHCASALVKHSFSISQKFDSNVLEVIRIHFVAKAKVNKRTSGTVDDFFYFKTYSRDSVRRVVAHCVKYPLLGEKAVQFHLFLLRPAPEY